MWVSDAINFCKFPMVIANRRQMFTKPSSTLNLGFEVVEGT